MIGGLGDPLSVIQCLMKTHTHCSVIERCLYCYTFFIFCIHLQFCGSCGSVCMNMICVSQILTDVLFLLFQSP